ncbi:MAG: hypothetical protein NC548_11425 [Lachnospiraceae bacterium]|nr:hypothetical protein [Lachnospiraceae bacterium]MCM1234716.1 hypothetical protein [Ruminococcus flavefaciens]
MEEAKSLVHMAITALFAALILAAVLALITLGNIIWRAFSNQNDANRRMREYSKFSAFDGTEVRGQDVIALLHDTQGSPYILIVDQSYKPIMTACDDVSGLDALNSSIPTTPNASDEVVSILASVCGGQTKLVNGVASEIAASPNKYVACYDYSTTAVAPTYSAVQEFFLARGEKLSGVSGYTKYKSYILYDGDNTTDIVGILMKELAPDGGGP